MNLLEMKNVKKSFGDLQVLKDISLTVADGEIVSIIGPFRQVHPASLRHAARNDGRRYTEV